MRTLIWLILLTLFSAFLVLQAHDDVSWMAHPSLRKASHRVRALGEPDLKKAIQGLSEMSNPS